MNEAKNIIPTMNEVYYTITMDGRLMKVQNTYSKSDMFNIVFSLCWDSPYIQRGDLEHAKRTLVKVVEENRKASEEMLIQRLKEDEE